MAKKNVISDFSALKGKISFSEPCHDVKKPSQPEAEAMSKPKEEYLKTGQVVVLMDSNLRGKIVSIGRKVGIELENGLIIEAAYGEFAVTDESELSSLKESKVKAKRTESCKSRPDSASGSLTVDLHIEAIPGGRNIPKGRQLEFQLDTFRKIIRQNLSHRGMSISFIHGIGDGILKTAIRRELDEVLALRCSYSTGDPAVTKVTIR